MGQNKSASKYLKRNAKPFICAQFANNPPIMEESNRDPYYKSTITQPVDNFLSNCKQIIICLQFPFSSSTSTSLFIIHPSKKTASLFNLLLLPIRLNVNVMTPYLIFIQYLLFIPFTFC